MRPPSASYLALSLGAAFAISLFVEGCSPSCEQLGTCTCEVPTDCYGHDGACGTRTCIDGQCGIDATALGTPCGADGNDSCDGSGRCLFSNGRACSGAAECASGSCGDGVCCDVACDGLCTTCAAEATVGICAPVEAGIDIDGECGDGVCDGAGRCSEGGHLWSHRFGDGSDQHAAAIAIDTDGGVTVSGWFQGAIEIEPGSPLQSTGLDDVFVARFSADGTASWGRRFGDANGQQALGVAVDAAGNVVVAGSFGGTMNIGQTLQAVAGTDAFVAKLDGSGAPQWGVAFGGSTNAIATAVAVDADGASTVVGSFDGNITVGAEQLQSVGMRDMFVAKLTSDGDVVWAKRFGDADDQEALAVALSSDGNVLVTGQLSGTVNFGGGAVAGGGGGDVFVLALDPAGAHLWSVAFGDGSLQRGSGIAAVPATGAFGAGVVVAGAADGAVDFGGGAVSSAGALDAMLARFDQSEAQHHWSQLSGSGGDQAVLALAADPAGALAACGQFSGSLELGQSLESAGADDGFVAKLGPNGNPAWSLRFGDSGPDQACRAAAIGADGAIAIAGSFAGSLDLGGATLTSAGGSDLFVASFAP